MLQIAKINTSNQTASHGEWFIDVKFLEKLGYVETSDDIVHPIAHICKVSLAMQDGRTKYLSNVLHVPNITKNLISIGQMLSKVCMSNLTMMDAL